MRKWTFSKTHATLNDFVVLQDRHAMLPLTEADVRALTDRRAGVGGDGVLRAVKAQHIPGWDGDPDIWFMDYRNADGSIAEMCGNGLRAFVRYLLDMDLVSGDEIHIGTRAGLRIAWPQPDGQIRTWMGEARLTGAAVRVSAEGRSWPAVPVDVGNPHAVVRLDTVDELDSLRLLEGPSWEPAEAFPDGVNVEFVALVGENHLRMRVFERGAGETMSCGTGVVAAAAAMSGGRDGVYLVDVPGGRLRVELTGEGAFLTGPAVLVGTGDVLLPDAE
ncbi:MAG: diaminopimelate epimerase [Propionibacteriaceae bacterium]|nr:diaminopimelate epimerase [Propionibacteriaceae bacterium]